PTGRISERFPSARGHPPGGRKRVRPARQRRHASPRYRSDAHRRGDRSERRPGDDPRRRQRERHASRAGLTPHRHTSARREAGRARLLVDGDLIVDNWHPTERGKAFFGWGSAEAIGQIDVRAANAYTISVEFVPAAPAMGGLMIGCRPPEPPDLAARAVALAE